LRTLHDTKLCEIKLLKKIHKIWNKIFCDITLWNVCNHPCWYIYSRVEITYTSWYRVSWYNKGVDIKNA
jgi:hypothetical protein